MIRVLVADDSRAARVLLRAILEEDPEIEVVAEVADGAAAVENVRRLRPDVITMDIHMPVLDGLEATARIMNETPTPIVVVSSSVSTADVASSMEAIKAGAVMALPKPGGVGAGNEHEASDFVKSVKAMAQVKVVRRWSGAYRAVSPRGAPPEQQDRREPGSDHHRTTPTRTTPPLTVRRTTPVNLVAIAASTGGPTAIQRVLSELPASFPVPILVVQHIARGFAPGFASWLGAASPLRVQMASDGDIVQPGTVYLGPDDKHLGISALRRIRLSDAPLVNGFRPSASVLFESASEAMGSALVSVILTGMGTDGVSGLRQARAKGGYVIAQDERTSLIYGMPGEAVAAGITDAVLPIESIAEHLRALVQA